jgi:hypothetical protein
MVNFILRRTIGLFNILLPFQGEKLKKTLCSRPAGLGYAILVFHAETDKKRPGS